jgi:hypothetical protein
MIPYMQIISYLRNVCDDNIDVFLCVICDIYLYNVMWYTGNKEIKKKRCTSRHSCIQDVYVFVATYFCYASFFTWCTLLCEGEQFSVCNCLVLKCGWVCIFDRLCTISNVLNRIPHVLVTNVRYRHCILLYMSYVHGEGIL